jgi:sugar O-acyltransferase (sialic acid O-acetyltransferase NeuD family)
MKQKLILIGGGGHCKSAIEVIESTNQYNIVGILDLSQFIGNKVLDYKIIGSDQDIPKWVKENVHFLVTVGQIKSADLRMKLHQKVLDANGKFATIIASTARVSSSANIGKDTIIMHNTLINADSTIGDGCIINNFANIEHDVIIDDFCHISTGAMINGNCLVYKKNFIGSGSVIANNVSIVSNCVIGAGSVIFKNITQQGIYVGNPAKLLR